MFVPAACAFEDNFNSASSLDNYIVHTNLGHVGIFSGNLVLSSEVGNKFPYLTLKPELLTYPIRYVEITFKYLSAGRFGAGIAVDNYYPPNGSYYDLGHNSLLWTWNWGDPPSVRYGYYSFVYDDLYPENSYHTLKITGVPGNYNVYLDGVYVGHVTSTKNITSLWFGNPHTTETGDSWPIIYIDKVMLLESEFPTPTPSPTPTPFPYLSQKDSRWGGQIYDRAETWAPAGRQGIDRWGCTITSVAMILQKYHIRHLDGTEVDPGKLNAWLQAQPDGYIGPGLLNWLAVTRYVRQSHEAGLAETKLEYFRLPTTSTPDFPAILGLPGHFVVAYDTEGLNWQIKDPSDASRTTLPLSTTLRSVNRYVPSSTDLSYIMLVVEPGTTATLTDSYGNLVPLYWTNEYLEDDFGEAPGPSLEIAMLPKPDDGSYLLHTTNSGETPAVVKVYLYDEEGGVTQDDLTLPAETEADFRIQYLSAPEQPGSIALDKTSIFEYLKLLRQPKTPANGIFQALYARFTNLLTDLSTAANLNKFISQQTPKFVSPEVSERLHNYVMLIEENQQ